MRVFLAGAGAAVTLLAAAACGEGETTTVVVTETDTETVTVTESPPLEEDRAYLVAVDFCENAPLDVVALFQPGSPADLAREFADQIRPELREAALEGCLAGLGRRE